MSWAKLALVHSGRVVREPMVFRTDGLSATWMRTSAGAVTGANPAGLPPHCRAARWKC